jgi:hypothetical protein
MWGILIELLQPAERLALFRPYNLDAMFQERRVAAIMQSTYEVDRGTQVIFLCRRNLAVDILWPIFRDCNKIQGSGAVKEDMV